MPQVGLIGEPVDLTYTYTHLGSEGAAISQLAPGQPFFEALKKAAHPVVVVGPGVLNRYTLGGGPGKHSTMGSTAALSVLLLNVPTGSFVLPFPMCNMH